MIHFKRVATDDAVVDYVVRTIELHLGKDENVLWMVSGGSAMNIANKAAQRLGTNPRLANLAISLTDERYGPTGHPDSNWQQLADKGFSLSGARLLPVLQGQDIDKTANKYRETLDREIELADFSMALAGMGPDGHIFGIKPGSPAVQSSEDVVSYNWDDYTRLTPTFNLIKRLSEVIVYAVGTEKHLQIDKLEEDRESSEQPAQLLKRLNRVTFFNDYKGEKL